MKTYRLIELYNADAFSKSITHFLEQGWQLHGPTQATINRDGSNVCHFYYHQALVKEDDLTEPVLSDSPAVRTEST